MGKSGGSSSGNISSLSTSSTSSCSGANNCVGSSTCCISAGGGIRGSSRIGSLGSSSVCSGCLS